MLAMVQELRVFLVLLSGAVATVFACFGVCPAEACRIRMVADPQLNAQGFLKVVQAGQVETVEHVEIERSSKIVFSLVWMKLPSSGFIFPRCARA